MGRESGEAASPPLAEMPSPAPKFIADSNVGRLGRWLRILGYDVTYDAFIDDGELVRQALAEGRIILTRDNGIIRRRAVRDGGAAPPDGPAPRPAARYVFVLRDAVDDQLRQVIRECGLSLEPARFWTRCPMDNAEIRRVSKDAVAGRVPPHTYRTQSEFSECPCCGRIYWRGTHLERFLQRIRIVSQCV